MAGASPANRNDQIAALADQFVVYLRQGTDIEIAAPGAVSDARGSAALLAAVERLDLALGQLLDLASVYEMAGPSLEPFTMPAAALTGEYLRHATGATWLPPDPDDPMPDDTLTIVTAGGIAIDLLGLARATLLSGNPNLRAIVARLIEEPSPEG
jgi:hypothetical protein